MTARVNAGGHSMGGTMENDTPAYHQPIVRWRDRVIELDMRVEETRRAVDRAVGEFQDAVRERDRAADHLRHLIAWATSEAAA